MKSIDLGNKADDFDQIIGPSSQTPRQHKNSDKKEPCFQITFLDDKPEIALEKHQEQLLMQDLKI